LLFSGAGCAGFLFYPAWHATNLQLVSVSARYGLNVYARINFVLLIFGPLFFAARIF
jgi:hypothetical protein